METAGGLRGLLTEVVQARGALALQRRRQPVAQMELGNAQDRLADALSAYADGLTAEGAPMPYRLRDELRLLNALGGPGHHP